ncbi:hypothetical protein GCM10017562_59870 [Streptomyces roseofulvus]
MSETARGREGDEVSGPPAAHLRFTVAYALTVLPSGEVDRARLRSLLPQGTVRVSASGDPSNRVTEEFRGILRQFERKGWIVRSADTVRITDRRSLSDYVRRLPRGGDDRLAESRSGIREAVETWYPKTRPEAPAPLPTPVAPAAHRVLELYALSDEARQEARESARRRSSRRRRRT